MEKFVIILKPEFKGKIRNNDFLEKISFTDAVKVIKNAGDVLEVSCSKETARKIQQNFKFCSVTKI